MENLNTLARYAFPPNARKYCGPDCGKKLFQYIIGGFNDEEYVKAALSKFETMFPYLELIAKANGKSPFDEEVVKAYWQGNGLLENVGVKEWKKTVEKIGKNKDWPKEFAEKYSERITGEFLPHHSFHVLNSFSLTVKEPAVLLDRINNCIIGWGKVVSEYGQEKMLEVERKPIVLKGTELVFGAKEILKIDNAPFQAPQMHRFFYTVENSIKGDFVSMHWGFACKRLEPEEAKDLENYTSRTLKNFKIDY
ncbi:MAG: DUF6390 family protein [Candidatus Diapherotrites archaeon]|nr:DUF6390 family protein [Candidatus Diapherotrites archaeon]